MLKSTFADKVKKKLAEQFPVGTITGPRQSGKTTLCKTVLGLHYFKKLSGPQSDTGVLIHGENDSYKRETILVRPG